MITGRGPIWDILGADGSLARFLPGFECRPSQVQMAGLIRRAVEERLPAVIEAGTGTGKTLGYLAPLLLAQKKTVISTATKTLQEQIFFKDLPLLARATGREIDAVLMKGRKNYLCLYRYHQYFARPTLFKTRAKRIEKRIQEWLERTEYADRAELTWMRDDDPLWDSLSSSSDQCLGSECPHWGECYLTLLRWRAVQAEFIVVNHHLFFADLMVKKGGFGEIIPRFQVVLFDEAHTLEDIATDYLGISVSTNQMVELAADLETELGRGKGERGKEARFSPDVIRTGAEHMRDLLSGAGDRGRLDQEALAALREGLAVEIRQGLRSLLHEVPAGEKREEGALPALLRRTQELCEHLDRILSLNDPQWLTWYEKRKRTLVLHASPLEIAGSMKELLYQKMRRVIFTSATLSTGGNFDYFKTRLGLEEETLPGIFPSHFDFENQTLLYIPRDLPPPADTLFGEAIAQRIAGLLKITSGRALVLFTSYHNMDFVHGQLAGNIPYTLYKQGDAPRSTLLEAFREDTHSVLLATGSFWEGVDVPGETLSCLIIDKLPFDSPGDPLVAARIEAIRSKGGNPFMDYQLPSAIIALRQGLGRLIRNTSDRGLLAVLDARLLTSRYGRFFLESLPRIPLTHGLEDVGHFFSGIP
ncbi:MAG: ATP-dependent DNA helicase [Deltaproteobacteria bacterium]|nr:ATP-dependent DNA helicase [Deltaproteobacteria bacterium]